MQYIMYLRLKPGVNKCIGGVQKKTEQPSIAPTVTVNTPPANPLGILQTA